MTKTVGLALDSRGVGRIEFHEDDEQRVNGILGSFGLNPSDPRRRAFGISPTVVSEVNITSGPGAEGTGELVKKALLDAGFEVGVM